MTFKRTSENYPNSGYSGIYNTSLETSRQPRLLSTFFKITRQFFKRSIEPHHLLGLCSVAQARLILKIERMSQGQSLKSLARPPAVATPVPVTCSTDFSSVIDCATSMDTIIQSRVDTSAHIRREPRGLRGNVEIEQVHWSFEGSDVDECCGHVAAIPRMHGFLQEEDQILQMHVSIKCYS